MLRTVLIGLGALSLLCGLVAIATGAIPPALVFAGWGALILIGTLFERVVYKRVETARPGPGWQRTAERFIDDATGDAVTVYIRPETGERAYVRD